MKRLFLLALLTASKTLSSAPLLNHQALLDRETWWDNRDWAWYKENIPFFDCPDRDIVTTYYYRWELVTKHIVEGSAEHGYAFTEFMDRPFWSGTYGAISCPAGLQLMELRWLRSPQYAQDYARYWHRVPGAEPRKYSTWLADATWGIHAAQEAPALIADVYEPLVKNHQGWEKRHYVPEKGLFWQNGHDDGMEFNINSRQTKDILRGADALRPTLNAYLWADLKALSAMAEMLGKEKEAADFLTKAEKVKSAMQTSLWDAKRTFFFPRSLREEVSKTGHKVLAETLTYETGEFAGSPHGRELIGYVPWQFSMPDAGKGYEEAWKFLMQPAYFAAPFGPTSVEQKDPQFFLAKGCCWWSGRSWPYATAQTLKALANLLQDYDQKFIAAADFVELLRVYAQTHRKNGVPYIAEAADPFTGSWEGHDAHFHSEHYFHSNYADIVITGLLGLDVDTPGKLGLHPLFPTDWEFCALDNLKIRNREVSVVWDKTGAKYGNGKGLAVMVDGREIHRQATLDPVRLDLAPRAAQPTTGVPEMNLAVNNGGGRFPEITASKEHPDSAATYLQDGQYWYLETPANRWSTAGSEGKEASVEVDFGVSREFHGVELFLVEDTTQRQSSVALPKQIQVEEWRDSTWHTVPVLSSTQPWRPNAANKITFAPTQARKLRVMFTPQDAKSIAVSELRVLGPKTVENLSAAAVASGAKNLAKTAQLNASHTSKHDVIGELTDGIVQFKPTPRNRWTCWDSQKPADWLELSWEQPQAISRLELFLYDDRGGVRAPQSLHLETWKDGAWKPLGDLKSTPDKPTGNRRNVLQFPVQNTTKLRVHFKHRQGSYSGLTELEVY